MIKEFKQPETLSDAIRYFADPDRALAFVVLLRWPKGVACPRCGGENPNFLKTRRIWKCRACRQQFSVKVGTIFEDSPLGLDKWLPALWMLANSKNGVSSYEVGRALGVTQKTAWFMLGRIRAAMETAAGSRFEGEIEADEAFLGGKYENMHLSKRKRLGSGMGGKNKTIVFGMLERARDGNSASQIRAAKVPHRGPIPLFKHLRTTIERGSTVYTDAHGSYRDISRRYIHEVIDHAREYVRGKVHTNGVENFWSLLKRTIRGTYVSVDPFHVPRYLSEQVFRFNNRRASDGERFVAVIDSILGKRLTYRGLTGADLTPATT